MDELDESSPIEMDFHRERISKLQRGLYITSAEIAEKNYSVNTEEDNRWKLKK